MKCIDNIRMHAGSNPAYATTDGKYAEKADRRSGNYGTDTFTRKKRAERHATKQVLSQYK